ncbi:hypothetical protein [Parahaliea mediterranea]|uniref:hypothetical protein n=1 Tax=Parahaliea mediterranea TaxID=651086 RepID=UPI000E2F2AC8|nr:hypothetical protein [Parahaliea mediterranea]
MVPLSRGYSVYLVTGFHGDDKLSDENLGQVLAFEPESHTFVSPGLTLEMGQRLPNYYLRANNFCFPKWNGFRRITRHELRASYEAFLRENCKGDLIVPRTPRTPRTERTSKELTAH